MTDKPVLIIGDDPASNADLGATLIQAGMAVDSAEESFSAIEKLRRGRYSAVVLDPVIRQRLNAYVVLNFIEHEQPDMVGCVFVLTSMPPQTIMKTAPALASRVFRKPLEVPRLTEALLASCGMQTLSAPGGKRAVLLVEDDAATANVIREALSELGYSCQWIASGRQVLRALGTSHFDLILLDLVMPDVDGFDVLQQLKANRPRLLRRVVITTGIPEKYLATIDRNEICGIIQKPVKLAELGRMLERCGDSVPFEAGSEAPNCQ